MWFMGDQGYSEPSEISELKFSEVFTEKVNELKEKEGTAAHFPISGNIYEYRFLKGFGEDAELFQKKTGLFVAVGLYFIMIVQIIGPIIVLISTWYKIKIGDTNNFSEPVVGLGNFFHDVSGDPNPWASCIDYYGQRVLGLIFLVLFIMNGLYVLSTDRIEFAKLIELGELLHQEAADKGYRHPREAWLWLGAVINSWCLLTCAAAMCLLFVVAEEGPKGVIFDAFGLTFLYNLDDIGGDLAFLDEVWDEDFMGDVYGVMADIPGMLDDIRARRQSSLTPDNIYQFAECVVWVCLVALPLVFVFVEMQPKEDAGRRLGMFETAAISAPEQASVADVMRCILSLNGTVGSAMGL